eukprot:5644977-Prymnesium_polylepis.2
MACGRLAFRHARALCCAPACTRRACHPPRSPSQTRTGSLAGPRRAAAQMPATDDENGRDA